jgi:hypothetical protein
MNFNGSKNLQESSEIFIKILNSPFIHLPPHPPPPLLE